MTGKTRDSEAKLIGPQNNRKEETRDRANEWPEKRRPLSISRQQKAKYSKLGKKEL
jgi:hypothetical protein